MLTGSIYAALILGAVTMIYPFMIMISGSTKSPVDVQEFKPFPSFILDETMLYRKHVEGVFNERSETMKIAYEGDAYDDDIVALDDRFADAAPQKRPPVTFRNLAPPPEPNADLVAEWWRFVAQADLPRYAYTCGYVETPLSRTKPKALREFKNRIKDRFDGDLEAANRELGADFVQWHAFFLLPESFLLRREKPVETPLAAEFTVFKDAQPRWNRCYVSPEGFFKNLFIKTKYTREISEYNAAHDTRHESYKQVHLSRRAPPIGSVQERADWEEFVRLTLNLAWIRADEATAPAYREFLKAKYVDVQTLNRNYGKGYASFEDVAIVAEPPGSGLVLSDWDAFLQGWKDPDTGQMHMLPLEAIRIHSVDFMFRDYLTENVGSPSNGRLECLAAINERFGTGYEDILEVLPPQRDAHYLDFLEAKGEIRWEFVTRNFRAVLDYMVFHGRGVLNTVIYCSLAVFLALLVNPLAAYAMSRYKMAATYKILLFLMLTMAFPPMVTQIPQFLMLREFHLLNTFAALILPGLANGYAIFLLKGFFDSLPQELYESAALDGAGELRIFWQITMSLSKPILAVIGLQAFTVAYSNFMFALLICQDEKMWTLMVWLYQLQQRSGPGVIYASLLVAAIPTLLIFVFAQNIIMRGIVVPVEK